MPKQPAEKKINGRRPIKTNPINLVLLSPEISLSCLSTNKAIDNGGFRNLSWEHSARPSLPFRPSFLLFSPFSFPPFSFHFPTFFYQNLARDLGERCKV